MREAGLRVDIDARSERMNRKIRNAQLQKIPYMLVVGDRDVEAGQVSVRLRSEKDQGAMDLETFISTVRNVCSDRADGYGFGEAE
jgi:threonyl-tRNA synthetase